MPLEQKLFGYHYTSEKNFESMRTPGIDGYLTSFDDVAGIIPSKRFIRLGRARDLPGAATDPVVEGLLEPEPRSWTQNDEFPNLWRYLMNDVLRDDHMYLLRFEIQPADDAFVVDRAHMERELYREFHGNGPSTSETMFQATKRYFASRVPALEYHGGFDLPQLAIWSPVAFERLEPVWRKPRKELSEQFSKYIVRPQAQPSNTEEP